MILLTPKGIRWLETGHPWIFSTDLLKKGPESPGVVTVLDPKGKPVATALYSPASKIALRILSYKKEEITPSWWEGRIQKSIDRRKKIPLSSNAVRLVNAEADGLPSLIVDQYDRYLSIQFLSAGIDAFRNDILLALKKIVAPAGIVEKDDLPVRSLEKLPRLNQVVDGKVPETVLIQEGEMTFAVDLLKGQKTGAYLDQRRNRLLAGSLASGEVLDLFSYHGWFACQMAKRSQRILCVESSDEAVQKIKENAKRNGVEKRIECLTANVFDFLKNQNEKWDLINLDPPPFIKSRKDKEAGFRGYKEINLRALKQLKPEGLLITASCSHSLLREEFFQVLASACWDTGKTLQVFRQEGADSDHPIHAALPESDYLKCLFCRST